MPECTRYRRRSLGPRLAAGRRRIGGVVWKIENIEIDLLFQNTGYDRKVAVKAKNLFRTRNHWRRHICARAPCSRSSFVRTGRKIRRGTLKSLVWRFVSLGPAFSRQKARALRTNARFPGGLMLRSDAQQGISKASSDKHYGADSLRPPKRSSTPFRGAEQGRGNRGKALKSCTKAQLSLWDD
jgi:hypothetical protein